jgi:hypothetical protein
VRNITPLKDRFNAKVSRQPGDGCWLWTGHIGTHGYGTISIVTPSGRRPDVAHRVSYELYVGPIPDGLVIDHLCRARACVRPSHLEAVTPRTNFLRSDHPSAVSSRRNRCKYGHELTPENIRVSAIGKRDCRQCVRRRNAARRTTESRTLSERFESHIVRSSDDCWLWIGARAGGHPAIRINGATTTAARVGYELYVGPIPHGARIKRTCGIRLCVNPDHLRSFGGA